MLFHVPDSTAAADVFPFKGDADQEPKGSLLYAIIQQMGSIDNSISGSNPMVKVVLFVGVATLGVAVMAALGAVTALCFGLWAFFCPLSVFLLFLP